MHFSAAGFQISSPAQGLPYDVVDAVLSLGIDNLTDSCNRIEALQQMKKDPNFEALSISFKRVVNILKSGSARGRRRPLGV